jgi:hypothetical protein
MKQIAGIERAEALRKLELLFGDKHAEGRRETQEERDTHFAQRRRELRRSEHAALRKGGLVAAAWRAGAGRGR